MEFVPPARLRGENPRSAIYEDPECRVVFEDFGDYSDGCAHVAEVDGKLFADVLVISRTAMRRNQWALV